MSYLRFQVPALPAGAGPLGAVVTLTAEGGAGSLVELTEVADPRWRPGDGPPVLGRVWGTRRSAADGGEVSFDVSGAVSGRGGLMFALSSPDQGVAGFRSSEAGPGGPKLRLRHGGVLGPRPSSTGDRPTRGTEASGGVSGCSVGGRLEPGCGVLTGVSPGSHSREPRDRALREFERASGHAQQIYHAYHRGKELFPNPAEVALAREPGRPRLLFLNWKPRDQTWAQIAAGGYDATIDRLGAHIAVAFPEPFLLTVHHEPENDVVTAPGSGMTAKDYAAMFRHVVQRLRTHGAPNIVTVVNYMSYQQWSTQPWFADLYPGDDVVDWVGWSAYAYSDPGHGYGDFGELVNRTSPSASWPGMYSWAAQTFPTKPLMVAEWGVWQSAANPDHKPWLYRNAVSQLALFPRVKALVYFDSLAAEGRDSRTTATPEAAAAYRELMAQPAFDVRVSIHSQ